jgi:predicted amidophosphoribosyltransferase
MAEITIPGEARPGGVIEMIAHCLFHQTPLHLRGRCEDCGKELEAFGDAWYCSHCMRRREQNACPICLGQPWD